MLIGVPREIATGERRVALVPEVVTQLTRAGHRVMIERDAGSTYRINHREVRARDVHILFADASTGSRSPVFLTTPTAVPAAIWSMARATSTPALR